MNTEILAHVYSYNQDVNVPLHSHNTVQLPD